MNENARYSTQNARSNSLLLNNQSQLAMELGKELKELNHLERQQLLESMSESLGLQIDQAMEDLAVHSSRGKLSKSVHKPDEPGEVVEAVLKKAAMRSNVGPTIAI